MMSDPVPLYRSFKFYRWWAGEVNRYITNVADRMRNSYGKCGEVFIFFASSIAPAFPIPLSFLYLDKSYC